MAEQADARQTPQGMPMAGTLAEKPADAGSSPAGTTDLITVCDKCLTAACWQGEYMCWESQNAGVVQKTREELIALGREHSCFWKTDEELANL